MEDTAEHHFNRGGLSRNVSQTNILVDRSFSTLSNKKDDSDDGVEHGRGEV